MEQKDVFSLLARYISLIILALGNLWIIYKLATFPTISVSYFFINKLYPGAVLLGDNTIFFKGYYAQIIPACVAGAAYYLLAILNFSTPMNLAKRISSLIFIFLTFFILNTSRIIIFAYLFEKGYNYFDITHLLTWYVGSTLAVIFIWFSAVILFKIGNTPVYTDILNLVKEVKHKNL